MTTRPEWIRFIVLDDSRELTPCFMKLDPDDFSFYIFPFSKCGEYYFGTEVLGEKKNEVRVAFKEQLSSEKSPHLSIHQSGEIHAYANRNSQVKKLQIPELRSLRGQHVASVTLDSKDSLCDAKSCMDPRGRCDHFRIQGAIPSTGIRLSFYLNGKEAKFDDQVSTTLDLGEGLPSGPMHLGIAYFANMESLSNGPSTGSTTIAGWDPTKGKAYRQEFIYIRSV